jgi:hypothetical protein
VYPYCNLEPEPPADRDEYFLLPLKKIAAAFCPPLRRAKLKLRLHILLICEIDHSGKGQHRTTRDISGHLVENKKEGDSFVQLGILQPLDTFSTSPPQARSCNSGHGMSNPQEGTSNEL